MTGAKKTLNLETDPITLTEELVDIASPSHHEKDIADAIEAALKQVDGVEVWRFNNNVLARTQRGLGQRVILAGHMDTVPIADNVPSHRAQDKDGQDTLFGCGSVDMKSGLAVYLHAFAVCANDPALKRDITLVAYEGEEVASEFNGLGHIQEQHPEWLEGEVALLGEPSGGIIEAGCQGSIRIKVIAEGVRAHSARSWLGINAMHRLAPVLTRIIDYQPRGVDIDGCEYREGLNVVHVESGVATNTIPDEAWMFVNFRFAPDRSIDEAITHVLDVLNLEDDEGVSYEVDDAVPGALPGLSRPAAAELVAATGGKFRAKYGWTDVSRFSATGIPAVNFGPGDPSFAHKRDEQCPVWMITEVASTLINWLR
ncbi:succinyl-diaminopimelate desuccinylase [Corynebacterium poyangense]|uniref:Succinyl-diaminopimelate desuccinylase n=1 Tax=Corynebacterium poyangense TaxID=2684405 RepID=A0A7H0SN66_9CORY|nr:succinyl-diaminopimelate desuccinylase [Corynebacterium poyangense]QNQ89991.1 succinyl-diaminopimelate desuccinylase [Corynebacterium poyangense]